MEICFQGQPMGSYVIQCCQHRLLDWDLFLEEERHVRFTQIPDTHIRPCFSWEDTTFLGKVTAHGVALGAGLTGWERKSGSDEEDEVGPIEKDLSSMAAGVGTLSAGERTITAHEAIHKGDPLEDGFHMALDLMPIHPFSNGHGVSQCCAPLLVTHGMTVEGGFFPLLNYGILNGRRPVKGQRMFSCSSSWHGKPFGTGRNSRIGGLGQWEGART